ncbi:hypothetical protein GOODEAATRI_034001 [Goodea atripinnis]|uniref:Uncharacterized protein n=1 Tax=Goodea atripinnis TaxID=208336 RepID=A0ABV0P036_9TELE
MDDTMESALDFYTEISYSKVLGLRPNESLLNTLRTVQTGICNGCITTYRKENTMIVSIWLFFQVHITADNDSVAQWIAHWSSRREEVIKSLWIESHQSWCIVYS